jgi:hypothetical protein
MNGFADHGLDEGAFGEKTGKIVKAFDAFREFSFSPAFSYGVGTGIRLNNHGAVIIFHSRLHLRIWLTIHPQPSPNPNT